MIFIEKTNPGMRLALIALLASLPLAACSDFARISGREKSSPDEFAVVSHAPLSQPPDFALRPPQPGALRPQESTTRDQAKDVLIATRGDSVAAMADLTAGERSVLVKAGAENAEPDIRRKVDEETTALFVADKGVADKILFWRDAPVPGEPIDAAAEAKRLQDNASQGKPATADQGLTIDRRQKGLLEGLF